MNDEMEGVTLALVALLGAAEAAADVRSHDSSKEAPLRVSHLINPMTDLQVEALEITRDPVGAALRMAGCRLGERVFEAGGYPAMDTVAAAVCSLRPGAEASSEAWLYHRWKSIGADGWRP